VSKTRSESSPISPRDWQPVLDAYQASTPYNYAAIDDFLEPDVSKRLHQELIEHPGWRSQAHIGQPLIANMKPDIETISNIAKSIKDCCPSLFGDYELIEHWALMYPQNAARKVHADIGVVTLNIWLTPDEYNQDDSGGLIFFDVKRKTDTQMAGLPKEKLSYLWSEQYVKDHTQGKSVSVSYKCNRALLFDACTFHQTDAFTFVNKNPESYRINLSLAFDNLKVYQERSGSLKDKMSVKKRDV